MNPELKTKYSNISSRKKILLQAIISSLGPKTNIHSQRFYYDYIKPGITVSLVHEITRNTPKCYFKIEESERVFYFELAPERVVISDEKIQIPKVKNIANVLDYANNLIPWCEQHINKL